MSVSGRVQSGKQNLISGDTGELKKQKEGEKAERESRDSHREKQPSLPRFPGWETLRLRYWNVEG